MPSLTERTRNIIYPTGSTRFEIPLWMKFFCYEYNSSAAGRASIKTRTQGGIHIPSLTNLKAKIMVPAPANFETSTSLKYTNQPSAASDLLPPMYGAGTTVNWGAWAYGEVGQMADALTDALTAQQFGYNRTLSSADANDLTYEGSGSVRNYEIRLYLPCLSTEDSESAGEIVRSFEALCLPSAIGIGNISALRYFHPPLWIFGIGPADSLDLDPDWSGSMQVSVLTQTKVRKQALDTNTLAAFSNKGKFKPVAYSLTLLFRELEPAFRAVSPVAESGITILNRSGVITTGGVLNPLIRNGF
jgi:hypothetical protein